MVYKWWISYYSDDDDDDEDDDPACVRLIIRMCGNDFYWPVRLICISYYMNGNTLFCCHNVISILYISKNRTVNAPCFA